jgi:hypothetical protein
LSHLQQQQQQRPGVPSNSLQQQLQQQQQQQQQQSLYRQTSGGGLNLAGQDLLGAVNRQQQHPGAGLGGVIGSGGGGGGMGGGLRQQPGGPSGLGEIGGGLGGLNSNNGRNDSSMLSTLNRFQGQQQQQPPQQQQQQPSQFSGFNNPLSAIRQTSNSLVEEDNYLSTTENEDFPALPGHKHEGGGHLGSGLLSGGDSNIPPAMGLGSSLLERTTRAQQAQQQHSQLFPGSGGGGGLESGNISSNSSLSGMTANSQLPIGGGLGSIGTPAQTAIGQQQQQSSATSAATTSATTTSGVSGLSKDARFGMAGLLENIRSTDKVKEGNTV